ncbi:MAG: hypothetical protein J7L17_04005 [Thaumarchaeota archaeon]|nr:hypothetical protein [Nitrososphaerota archaeon]
MARRPKRRYLAVYAEPKANPEDIARAIESAYQELFGKLGLASAMLRPVRSYPDRGVAIIRCSLESLPKTILAIASVTRIGEERTALRILSISGTIRSLKDRLEEKNYLKRIDC